MTQPLIILKRALCGSEIDARDLSRAETPLRALPRVGFD